MRRQELERRHIASITKPFELEELLQRVKTLLTEPSHASSEQPLIPSFLPVKSKPS